MLAETIGVTKYAIYAYTSGRAYPNAKNLMALCKALGRSEKTILAAIREARNEKRRTN